MSTEFSFSDARSSLTDITNDVAFKGNRVIITRNGKQHVAIVSIEDLEMIEAIEDKIDLEDAKKALTHAKKHGTISWNNLKKELDL